MLREKSKKAIARKQLTFGNLKHLKKLTIPGIYPLNRHVFDDHEFAPATVTDRPAAVAQPVNPKVATQQPVNPQVAP